MLEKETATSHRQQTGAPPQYRQPRKANLFRHNTARKVKTFSRYSSTT